MDSLQGNEKFENLAGAAGLDSYPDSTSERMRDDINLEDINKVLPKNLFGSVMSDDTKKLGLGNVDIWYGSNVQLNGQGDEPGDGGALYQKWCQLAGIDPRVSSHEHLGQEYQIRTGYGNSALLFGRNAEG